MINDVEIDFGPGFNVLTGETGAGKSIIVGALNLVLGGRASAETVRGKTLKARVDAVFHIPTPPPRLAALLEEHDIAIEDEELLLSRVVTGEGRSRAYVAGNMVRIAVLAEIGDELVDIHGQHEHQSLLKPDRQLDLLDAFAGTEKAVADVSALAAQLRGLDKAIVDLESDDRERLRRIEFLRFEASEIESANVEPGEEEELKARHNIIANAECIFSLASRARDLLYEAEDGAAISAVDGALGALKELCGIDECFQQLARQLEGVRAGIEEAATEIRDQTAGLEFDPRELDTVNERLDIIRSLKRKYGSSLEAVLAYRDKALAEIEAFEARDQRLADMRDERDAAGMKASDTARALSKERAQAARKLDKLVTAVLQELGMKGGRFETSIRETHLGATGVDQVEFMLAANPGEEVRPLRQVASGGEISRIMLALKSVFAHADRIPTLIFDEIDAGVGGHIASNVAEKLRALSDSHQTICITHLPQIVAAARMHHRVTKHAHKGRTVTRVTEVTGEQRIEEVARLLDGSVSELSLKHARALVSREL